MRFEDYVDNDFDALVDRLPPGYSVEEDSDIFERMVDFLIALEPEQLSEDQLESLVDIFEDMEITYNDLEDSEEMEEALAPKRRRIKPSEKRERRKYYRQHRAQIKRKVRKYKKSAKGRRMKKLAKRMAKRGKTATGKRRTKFY